MSPGRTSVEPQRPAPPSAASPGPADSLSKQPQPIDVPPATSAPPSRAASLEPSVGAEADDDADSEASASEPPPTTIDLETFHQILDLDEDDTHDFSRGMAWAYFSQASTTFTEMDEAYAKKDLGKLSSLGHFLKGSSAALGVAKVQASCEQIQHYGQLRDEEAGTDLTDTAALQKIAPLLTRVKAEYAVAETWLKNWYEEHGGLGDEEDG
ncbi:histidine-phosphotransfer domain HPT domain-containing protein [Amylocystis lapponica]|nr:histidine-phosphotransfer domain HPT domain-containing protein [Amylocystis lapponica]